ncbi:MAG TPA: 6-carboxytetrahydropterin synthase QueD [Phycisphaerales bacterium]|nr:6-carboxytetrahydropterin synthase QueD [Phycisphaerales bacterium]|tara:strand:- start:90 stop:503 length:414 start_codon:yes stop_codon:yes gene_type:complete
MRSDLQSRIAVQRRFRARHAVIIGGVEEELHEHDWHVQVEVSGALDDEGLLLDFHLLERVLDDVLRPFVDGCFNGTPPFDVINPSAECIARYIIETIVHEALPSSARSRIEWGRATLEEAPGCHATCFAVAAKEKNQ